MTSLKVIDNTKQFKEELRYYQDIADHKWQLRSKNVQ